MARANSMKLNDTVESVLQHKGGKRVLPVTTDQSVYAAIEKMAEESVGDLLVLSENKAGRHHVGARLCSQRNP